MRVDNRAAICFWTIAACGGANDSAHSDRQRAVVELSAGRGGGLEASVSPRHVERVSETRASVRVREKHSVMLGFELPVVEADATATSDCAAITLTVVAPSSATLGERVILQAHSGESVNPEVRYAWSGPAQLEPAEDTASFQCDAPGQYGLSLRLISPEACATELPFSITCE